MPVATLSGPEWGYLGVGFRRVSEFESDDSSRLDQAYGRHLEIDALDPVLDSPRKALRLRTELGEEFSVALVAGLFFLTRDSRAVDSSGAELAVIAERIRLLSERCERVGAVACILRTPPSFWLSAGPEIALARIREEWSRSSARLFFDFGQGGHQRAIGDFERAADPLWTKPEPRSPYWRVHGWHAVRWVRRYSQEALLGLHRAVNLYRPPFVVFAHSQRSEQAEDFLKLADFVSPEKGARP